MAKTIITLGREYCTGGRFIAEDVANALGIKLYDKELITMAAKNSGLSEEAVAASEKRHTHSLLYSLYTMGNELPLGDQVFILQSRIIKQLAEEGPCVILGRCGDYVLRERKDVLRVFVYAPKEWRLQYAKTNPLVKAKDEKGIKDVKTHTHNMRCRLFYRRNITGIYNRPVNFSDMGNKILFQFIQVLSIFLQICIHFFCRQRKPGNPRYIFRSGTHPLLLPAAMNIGMNFNLIPNI